MNTAAFSRLCSSGSDLIKSIARSKSFWIVALVVEK